MVAASPPPRLVAGFRAERAKSESDTANAYFPQADRLFLQSIVWSVGTLRGIRFRRTPGFWRPIQLLAIFLFCFLPDIDNGPKEERSANYAAALGALRSGEQGPSNMHSEGIRPN